MRDPILVQHQVDDLPPGRVLQQRGQAEGEGHAGQRLQHVFLPR